MQMKIAIMCHFLTINYQFLKATIKCNITWKLEASVSIEHKIAALSIFSRICQKSISLANIFQLCKYQVLAFINIPTTSKIKQSSAKFRIWKFLIVKLWPFKFLTKFEEKSVVFASAIFFKTLLTQN